MHAADYIPQLFKRNEGYSVPPGEIRILSRANEIIRSFWKENNFKLMILLLSFFLPWDTSKLLAVATARIRRLRFGPGIHARCVKLNSQKWIAKSRGDDVARIITVFRAGTSVISRNWSSFRTSVANWNLFILILSSSGTKSYVRAKRRIWIDRNAQRPSCRKGEIKGSIYLVGAKIFPWENEVHRSKIEQSP